MPLTIEQVRAQLGIGDTAPFVTATPTPAVDPAS